MSFELSLKDEILINYNWSKVICRYPTVCHLETVREGVNVVTLLVIDEDGAGVEVELEFDFRS